MFSVEHWHSRVLTLLTLPLQLFAEAVGVLHQIGRLPEQTIQEFKLLGVKAKATATEARDTEALLGEIPEEFLDPIQVHRNIFRVYIFYFEN